ncbi:hypothetical protein [Novipirellula caenicola]|uniref:GYF domain-containing protein n=1 Tax=Novipirellula caenicola TaxID=1536901 RepID=A0ABP9VIV6_9BACT
MDPQHYSLKRSDQWKWEGRYTAEEVVSRITEDQLGDDWLVAPFASEEPPVDARKFATDPSIFVARRQRRQQIEDRHAEISANVPTPFLLTWGKRGLGLFFAFLLIGRVTVSLFFPHLRGSGMPPAAWFLLIPAWTVGGASLIATAIGLLQKKSRVSKAIADSCRP